MGIVVPASFQHITVVLKNRGRIGRLKFFNYSKAIPLLVGALSIISYSLYHNLGFVIEHQIDFGDFIWSEVASSIHYVVLIYIPLHYIFTLLVGIARFHDINKPGWFSLLLLIPFAPYVLYFWPGNKAKNSYGHPPVKNTFLDWLPLLGIIVFAIAVYSIKFLRYI